MLWHNDEQYVLSNLRIDSSDFSNHPDAVVLAHYAYHCGLQSSGMTANLAHVPSSLPPTIVTIYQQQTYNSSYNIFNRNTVQGVVWHGAGNSTYVLQNIMGLGGLVPSPNTALVRFTGMSTGSVIWDNNNYYTSLDRCNGHVYLAGGIDYSLLRPTLWSGQYTTQCGMELAMPQISTSCIAISYPPSDIIYNEIYSRRQYVVPSNFENRMINCLNRQ